MALDFTGIDNIGEFYSPHYLDAVLDGDLKDVFKRWKERGAESPVRRLLRLSEAWFKALAGLESARSAEERLELAAPVQAELFAALGYERRPTYATPEDADGALPLFAREERDGRPWLWIVEVPPLSLAEQEEGADALEQTPLASQLEGFGEAGAEGSAEPAPATESWRTLLDRAVFRGDAPPRWIILTTLREILLVDGHKWARGKHLRFNLEELFRRRDAKALRAMAGLLHREIINPNEGLCVHDTLDENSHKHAYTVSTDLKKGAREAIEMLANEALRYKREVSHEAVFSGELSEDLANRLKTEAIVYLYRLIFLFYVEARGGELGIVPMGSEEYRLGYSLETLRDLELVPLTSLEAQEGFYLHESLEILFRLVNKGFGGQGRLTEGGQRHGFAMPALRSPLFDPDRTPIFASVKLRNRVLQEVLQLLSLSRPKKGKKHRRGRISYAQLGINQLGAVYEGLLSYSGFFARETLYEVRHPSDMKAEDPKAWFVPESEIGKYRDEEIVRERYGEGERRVRYPKGHFLFRLTGRDREKSASYYTPEVLTRCLVKYTLKERLKTVETAAEILELTVCEPAMGSGAFLVEAVNQLAEAYLARRQEELGEAIPAEAYADALQRVKRRITVRNVYGVDLNPLAAELGKLSLWLNCLHEGARAPYLELNIRAGNSLIGGRREVYAPSMLSKDPDEPGGKKKSNKDLWFNHAPTRIKPGETRPDGHVYHFLLPFTEMAPFEKDKVVKKLLPEQAAKLKAWRKDFVQPPTPMDLAELQRLSGVVDELWEKHTKQRNRVKFQIREQSPVWGEEAEAGPPLSYKACAEAARHLDEPEAPGKRLRAVMDYWCVLWFWPLLETGLAPTWGDWLGDLKALLEGDLIAWQESTRGAVVERVLGSQMSFVHWELDLAELFAERGGFDLIVGNPPWVKVEWNEQGILGDLEPVTALRRMSAKQVAELRGSLIELAGPRDLFLRELEGSLASAGFLNSESNYRELAGVQTNLYKCFMVKARRDLSDAGVAGLVHGKGVYDDPKGGRFRAWLLHGLRWRFHYYNRAKVFADVHHERHFETTVYARSRQRDSRQITNLFHPRTIDESMEHDGHGPVPVLRTVDGQWEMRGHRSRIIELSPENLALFAELFDEPGTPAEEARLPLVHSVESIGALERLAHFPDKLRDVTGIFSTVCLDESLAQQNGLIARTTVVPEEPDRLIYSGPHFFVANPLNKQPNEGCRHNQDYSTIDHCDIDSGFLPRTVFEPCGDDFSPHLPHVNGDAFSQYFRHVNRRMIAPTGERTLINAIIPPGPSHVDLVFSVLFKSFRDLLRFSSACSSLPVDFLAKSTGKSDARIELLRLVPMLSDFCGLLSNRTLALNCLTNHYRSLWSAVFDAARPHDSWSLDDPRLPPWSRLTQEWTWDTPLRTPFARRQALVEIDALAALELGITADELCAIYRSQFWVLQQYEADTWYDQRGMIVFTNNRGLSDVGLSRKDWEAIKEAKAGDTLPEYAAEFVPPFDRCDREEDMRRAYAHFEPILAARKAEAESSGAET